MSVGWVERSETHSPSTKPLAASHRTGTKLFLRRTADLRSEVMLPDGTTGYGRVDYTCRMGNYEVSQAQSDSGPGTRLATRNVL